MAVCSAVVAVCSAASIGTSAISAAAVCSAAIGAAAIGAAAIGTSAIGTSAIGAAAIGAAAVRPRSTSRTLKECEKAARTAEEKNSASKPAGATTPSRSVPIIWAVMTISLSARTAVGSKQPSASSGDRTFMWHEYERFRSLITLAL